MKLFECQACGMSLSFEDTQCLSCGRSLGFIPEVGELSALDPTGYGDWLPWVITGQRYRFCGNDQHAVCNWMVPADSGDAFCPACRLNRTIPDLSKPEHIDYWRSLERGKHRLVYGLMKLNLPLTPKHDHPEVGLAFDFLAPDESSVGDDPAVTGHARGLITINILEADDVDREQFRANFSEPYRTVLGHFRHEVGHYYWERLVQDSPALERFRRVFGDERINYQASLGEHYSGNRPVTWPDLHITKYAAAHPWEDWAETWAHYLHLLDTVETAYWYGLSVAPKAGRDPALTAMADFDPYAAIEFDDLQRVWFPVVYLGNGLNRSMGQPDLYPFVLTPVVLKKLRFVHDIARSAGTGSVSKLNAGSGDAPGRW